MSDTSKFWVAINMTFVLGIVAIVYISTNYWSDHNTKLVEMIVDHNIDPVAAMCAMQDDYGKHPTCIVLAVKAN